MSTSHIPQPAAGAPDEVFDSVSSQAVQPVVSALGVPAGPPQEVTPHTGQFNGIDPAIMKQWVPQDTVIWSVTMPSGQMIWKRPIHPTYSNPLLSYLCGMYNTWGGNISYRFKVAGTGFHAGAIAIVRVPPNRDPEEFTTPTSWGAFEYLVIDPKTLETESVGVSDQRPIAYHYMKFDQANNLTFGGWIAMYVLIPLNTSATGSQQIAVQVFSKPGDMFQVSQLIVPSANKGADPFPPAFSTFFDFSYTRDYLTTSMFKATHLVIEPNTVAQTMWVANCITTSGKKMSKWKLWNKHDCDKTYGYNGTPVYVFNLGDSESRHFFLDYIPIWKPKDATFVSQRQMSGDKNERFELPKWTLYLDDVGDGSYWKCSTVATTVDKTCCSTYVNVPELVSDYTDNVYGPVASGESVVHFSNDSAAGMLSVQTVRLTTLFKSGLLDSLFYSGVCALFTIVSVDENIPIGHVKLYAEGFFAGRSSGKRVPLPIQNIKLVFAGFIARTDPIPVNTEYNKNRLILYGPSWQPQQ